MGGVVGHIQCAVCKIAVKEAAGFVKEKKLEDEEALGDLVEQLCSPSKKEGKWVTKLDIVRNSDAEPLKVQRQEKTGTCRKECKAIQRACSGALRGKEDDFASMLAEAAGVGKMQAKICKQVCAKAVPNLGEWADEKWEEDKDAAVSELMDSMKGMPGMENMRMF